MFVSPFRLWAPWESILFIFLSPVPGTEWMNEWRQPFVKWSVCVCVCVRKKERKRERMKDRHRYHSIANLLEFWAWNLKQHSCSVRSPGSKIFWISNYVLWVVLCICEVRIIDLLIGIEMPCFCENIASSLIQQATFNYGHSLVSSFSSEESRKQTLRLWERVLRPGKSFRCEVPCSSACLLMCR